ncbi:hypothetical protein SATMO3_22810 [Sporomusa aerivorans]
MSWQWKRRCKTQKILNWAIFCIIKALALFVLWCGNRKVRIEHGAYDLYPSCNNWQKTYCPAKSRKYLGYMTEGLVVFGDSLGEIYAKIITLYVFRGIYFPWVK